MDGKQIEEILARNGDRVLKYQGKLLASSVDPRREAKDWVNRWRDRLNGAERAVVLGFGCGYHLVELAEAFPKLKILALGAEPELMENLKAIQIFGSDRLEVVVQTEPVELIRDSRVRAFLRGGFILLEHSSTQNLDRAFYRELKERLIAREPLFFADWISQDPRLRQIFPLQAIPGGEERRLLSIKDLERFINQRDGSHAREAMAFRVLRELVR